MANGKRNGASGRVIVIMILIVIGAFFVSSSGILSGEYINDGGGNAPLDLNNYGNWYGECFDGGHRRVIVDDREGALPVEIGVLNADSNPVQWLITIGFVFDISVQPTMSTQTFTGTLMLKANNQIYDIGISVYGKFITTWGAAAKVDFDAITDIPFGEHEYIVVFKSDGGQYIGYSPTFMISNMKPVAETPAEAPILSDVADREFYVSTSIRVVFSYQTSDPTATYQVLWSYMETGTKGDCISDGLPHDVSYWYKNDLPVSAVIRFEVEYDDGRQMVFDELRVTTVSLPPDYDPDITTPVTTVVVTDTHVPDDDGGGGYNGVPRPDYLLISVILGVFFIVVIVMISRKGGRK